MKPTRNVSEPLNRGVQISYDTGCNVMAVQRQLRHHVQRPRARAALPRQERRRHRRRHQLHLDRRLHRRTHRSTPRWSMLQTVSETIMSHQR